MVIKTDFFDLLKLKFEAFKAELERAQDAIDEKDEAKFENSLRECEKIGQFDIVKLSETKITLKPYNDPTKRQR